MLKDIMNRPDRKYVTGATRLGFATLAAAALALGACTTTKMETVAPVAATPAPISTEQIAKIVASPDRRGADRMNDIRRKPEQMLAFIGVWPGMVVEDLSAGGGYTTELLARSVGSTGRVYAQVPPRASGVAAPVPAAREGNANPTAVATPAPAPMAAPAMLSNAANTLSGRSSNPAAGNIIVVVQKFEDPVPPEFAHNGLDLVTLMFNYHDLGFMGVDRAQMNRAVFAALKPGGMYVIADHSGRTGTGISESGTLHRVEESFLRSEVEAAGFKLVAEGSFLRNPNDPRNKNTPDPPMPKDEFVLKFVKP
jgi:predicted methyltransferase